MSEDDVYQAAHRVAYTSAMEALGRASSAEEVLAVVRAAQGQLDDALRDTGAFLDAKLACGAGCSFCCWLTIDVRAHEVFVLVRQLRAERSAEELGVLHEAAFRRTQARRTQPCPLLAEGRCSVYAVRPAACRRHHSRSVASCEAVHRNEPIAEASDYAFLTEIGRFTATGTHNALLGAGYDGYSYNLDAALAEAQCEVRWLAKQKAFSREAESAVPTGFSQAEAIAKVRAALPVV
jgi:uncharacterized protein